jgi:hypothetical protein
MKKETKITIKFSKDGNHVGTQEIKERDFYTAKSRLENMGYTVVKVK